MGIDFGTGKNNVDWYAYGIMFYFIGELGNGRSDSKASENNNF